MTTESSIHTWFTDRLAVALTHGLDADDQQRFDTHAAQCPACAAALQDARAADAHFRQLFQNVHPSPDFEDRVIQQLRRAESRKMIWPVLHLHPAIPRAAAAAAAVILVAGVGYVGSYMITERQRANQVTLGSNLQQVGQTIQLHRHGQDGQNVLFSDLNNATVNREDAERKKATDEAEKMHVDYNSKLGEYSRNIDKERQQNKDILIELEANRAREDLDGLSLDDLHNQPAVHFQYFKPSDERAIASASSPQQATAAPTSPPSASPSASTAPATPAPVESDRKIIRHGEMQFEVDSFDSAFLQISKIVAEERGFVDSTDSQKLENGKVSGTIVVRVPPEHLDTLVLKLRGLGDLKGQKIVADDITRQYTDLQSELRAAQAMQDRLLEIIKTGKGEVKDLLAAEKELGIWREKIEKITGQINYDNSLIAFSTLQITLSERDIRQAATASETENVSMGIETDDVQKARDNALRALDDAKARIIQSDLKQLDAGQLAATIVAEVAPDAAGPVTDRLKQLGRVARLDITRQQTTPDGTKAPAGVHVQRENTQLQISLYNLANIAPRQTTSVSMACGDVEKAYHQIIERVAAAGGRVVNSALNRATDQRIDATVNFEVPSDKAEALLAEVRQLGGVMQLAVTENPDTANVTAAKHGFVLTIQDLDQIPPRQTTGISVNCSDPEKGMTDLLAAALSAGGRVIDQNLSQGDQFVAHLVVDVPLKNGAELIDRARALGTLRNIEQTKNPAVPDADFVRARVDVTLVGASALVQQDAGIWLSFKNGLATSIRGLLYSLQLIVIGLCLLLPWAAILWGGWKGWRIFRARRATPV